MATFLDLYTTKLDAELSSSSTELFTTAKRKQAIRDAELAFIRETNATLKTGIITISDGTSEYSLGSTTEIVPGLFDDFLWLSDTEKPSIKIQESGGTVRYLQGRDFQQTTTARLNDEEPGWRGTDPGVPMVWYQRVQAGVRYLGCWPAPDVGAGETWTWLVPYVAKPDTLTDDTDIPFSFDDVAMPGLEPFHQALAHYAAAQLEPLRKNYDAVRYQMGLFAGYVNRFKGIKADEHPGVITMATSYLGNRRSRGEDPRR